VNGAPTLVRDRATATGDIPPASTPEQPLLLRVEEAARLLGLSRTATYGEVMSGRLESLVIGSRRRIPRQAVLDWIEQQRQAQRESQA
jgi:excisionase family DNA binding protein